MIRNSIVLRRGVLLVLICVLAAAVSIPTFAEELGIDQRSTITVQGQGQSSAIPDTVYITVGVDTRDMQADRALQLNSASMTKLFDNLKLHQIPEKNVQTVNFNISPEYSNNRRDQRTPEIIGYRVSNQVRVKVAKIEVLGIVLDVLVRDGANSVYGIQFDVDDPQAAEDEARKAAVADARRRAEVLAQAAGARVGKPLQISEMPVGGGPSPVMRSMAMAAEAVPIARGEQQISANVTVVFELLGQ